MNRHVRKLLCGVVSMREAGRILNLNQKTIARKLVFLGTIAKQKLLEENLTQPKAKIAIFDDLETFEHTKCKPVAVGLMVEDQTRRILGYTVARMPAKGLLAEISRKKYGRRADERREKRNMLFKEIKPLLEENALIKSDESPFYSKCVKRNFPEAQHKTFKGRDGCIVGQGELKKIGFDPLFALNHTCAVLRARTCRLIRRTWCTTKRPDRLDLHLALVCLHHNRMLNC